MTLEIPPESFVCTTCHLVIEDYALLVEAGLDEVFDAEGDIDDLAYEPEYENE